MTTELVKEPMLPADERNPVYWDEGEGRFVYRLSSIGLCLRALALFRMGYERVPPPDFVAEAARDGREREPVIIDRLKEMGWHVDGRQEEIEIRTPAWIIRGHLDGLARPAKEGLTDSNSKPADKPLYILEIKTMSEDRFEKLQKLGFSNPSFRTYAFQFSTAMYRLGLPTLYVVERRSDRQLFTFLIDEPVYPFATIFNHVATADRLGAEGNPPYCDGATTPYFCPVNYACEEAPNVTDPEQAAIIDGLALDYQEANAIEEAAKKRKESIKGRLAELIVPDGTPGEREGKATTDRFSVSVYVGKTPPRVDLDGLRNEFGQENVDRYVSVSTYEAVRVTAKKPKAAAAPKAPKSTKSRKSRKKEESTDNAAEA